MALTDLDHVNLRTKNLDAMVRFYESVLGMENGDRPPFPFGGAWLYVGDRAVVHLVDVTETDTTDSPQIEHFAFRAKGLPDTVKKLDEEGSDYRIAVVPGLNITQIFVRDPDGNNIEIQFAPDETGSLPAA